MNEQEHANVWSPEPEKQAAAIRKQALEHATFIVKFIEAEKIAPPKRVAGKDVGGVTFLAWSQGNMYLMSFLSNISQLDPSTNAVLERYLRTTIIYGNEHSFMIGLVYGY